MSGTQGHDLRHGRGRTTIRGLRRSAYLLTLTGAALLLLGTAVPSSAQGAGTVPTAGPAATPTPDPVPTAAPTTQVPPTAAATTAVPTTAAPTAAPTTAVPTTAVPTTPPAPGCPYSGATTAKLPASAASPHAVTVGLSAKKVTATVAVPAACADDLVRWRIEWGHGVTFTSARPTRTFDPAAKTFDRTAGVDDAALLVWWRGVSGPERTSFTASQLRRSTFGDTFNAVGEPLPAGGPLLLQATLKRADWRTMTYRPYAGRSVRVQWHAPGESYGTFGKEKTDTKGRIRALWTDDQSGTWRLQYAGNSTTAAATSRGDYVEVVP